MASNGPSHFERLMTPDPSFDAAWLGDTVNWYQIQWVPVAVLGLLVIFGLATKFAMMTYLVTKLNKSS